MSESGLFSLLWRCKKLLLLCGAATSCITVGVSQMLPRAYSSEGNLIIESAANTPDGDAIPSAVANVLTQVDVLQSKGLLQQLVTDLNLTKVDTLVPASRLPVQAKAAESEIASWIRRVRSELEGTHQKTITEFEQTLGYVQKHLTASSKDNSSVITVRFEAGSPETAAMVANGVMDAYLATINKTREAQIARTNEWVGRQIASRKEEVAAAERKVLDLINASYLTEVQGSLASAVQLSKSQENLVHAREELDRKQAALSTVTRGGSIKGSEEVLSSKTIQSLKEQEARLTEQISLLSLFDPRHAQLQGRITAIHSQIVTETDLIYLSMARAVDVARATVAALEKTIVGEMVTAKASSVAGAELRQLTSDLDTKRQLLLSFMTEAARARIGAKSSQSRILFIASPPEQPVRQFGAASAVIGFIGGVFGTAGIVVLRRVMSPIVSTTDDMLLVTGQKVFASLPTFKRYGKPPLVTETLRAISLAIRLEPNKGAVVLVTSSETGEGKTTIATALATRLVADGFRVLLIDADLRRSRLAATFGVRMAAGSGIMSALEGRSALQQSVLRINGLDCLLNSQRVDNPLKALSSEEFKELLADSRRNYDFVVLDSPPVLHVADPIILARLSQRIIFIVQAGRLPNDFVSEALRRFDQTDRDKMLTLLTRVQRSNLSRHTNYAGYAT
jgi:succinoglycan biosynthesis transport protein ExoP